MNPFKILVFIFSFATSVNAQTGIGTNTPNASAKLDVYSDTKGFLPPRVALTETHVFAPVTGLAGATEQATAAGLLVYNTTSNGAVTPGYYFWNGTSWVQIAGGLIIDNSKNSNFTLAASDNNKLFIISSSSPITVTVPSNLSASFSCQIIQGGSGMVTVNGVGVTLNTANGLSTRTTNSAIGIVMNSSTTGYIIGDSIF